MGDLLEVFEADDGEAGSGEAVLTGFLGGAGLALGGAGSGGFGGVGSIAAIVFRRRFFGCVACGWPSTLRYSRGGGQTRHAVESSYGKERGCLEALSCHPNRPMVSPENRQ